MNEKNILIVGASGGIGSALSTMFPDDTVLHHYYTNKPNQEERIFFSDIRSYAAVEKMVGDILQKHDRIDVLILASGTNSDSFAHKSSPEKWNEVVQTNLLGAYNVIRAVLPSMRTNKYGRVILISSVVFQRPVLGTSAYAASKSALVGLTRTVALENASSGITCNCLALGYFDAGMLYRVPEDVLESVKNSIPLRRFGKVSEIKSTVQFLIDTEYVTGQTISINGGLHMD